MIPRHLRASTRSVLDGPHQVVRTSFGVVRVAPGETGFSVVVPKKAAKLAVRRHLAKRRVSAALVSSGVEGFQVVVTLNAAGAAARGEALRAWCRDLSPRILQITKQ